MKLIDYAIENYDSLLKKSKKVCRDDILAEDTVQDIIVKLLSKERTTDNPKGYLNSTIFNSSIQTRRRHRFSSKRSDFNVFHVDIATNETPHTELVKKYNNKIIKSAIDELPKQQAKIMTYHMENDADHTDVAKKFNMNYDTAKATYRHGFLRIQDAVKDNCELVDIFKETLDKTNQM